jgi:ketosteroid isomerase-like protein
MRRFLFVPAVAAGLSIGCAQSANPEQGRASLTAIDREWSQTVKDPDKFVSYYATDASLYMPGTPILKGQDAIKKAYVQLSSTPGFSLQWAANKADIGSSGDIGYTAGTYQMGEEKGKYITVWKKQTDGSWKVTACDAAARQGDMGTCASLSASRNEDGRHLRRSRVERSVRHPRTVTRELHDRASLASD